VRLIEFGDGMLNTMVRTYRFSPAKPFSNTTAPIAVRHK
jgi:hypothetical protein